MKSFLRLFSILWCYLFCFWSYSQNFLQFEGDTNHFQIDSTSFSLNAPEPGTSVLTYDFLTPESFEISFNLSLHFNPSNSNRFRFYFTNSTGENAYIQVGESGSADGFDLYYNDEIVINGVNCNLSQAFENVGMKLSYNNDSLSLYYKTNQEWITEFKVPFHIESANNQLRFELNYTSSNTNHFEVNQFRMNQGEIDQVPPQVLSAEWLNEDSLMFLFNEELSYFESTGFLPHQSFFHLDTAWLVFNTPVPDQEEIEGWIFYKDAYQNLNETELTVAYRYPKMFDVIFSELMIDPSPSLGTLPEKEYIEIYTNKEIHLKNYQLKINHQWYSLPDTILPPNEFFTLSDEIIPSLNNTSFIAELWYKKRMVMDYYRFNIRDYRDQEKKDGGWSMEKINLSNHPLNYTNWGFHNTYRGGSPGEENSLHSIIVDQEPPLLREIHTTNSKAHFVFSQPVYRMIDSATQMISDTITFNYWPDALSQIKNFNNTPLKDTLIQSSIGSNPTLIISEVLGDGCDDTPDYIEITNYGKKAVNLDNLFLQKVDQGMVSATTPLPSSLVLLPSESRVFTSDFIALEQSLNPRQINRVSILSNWFSIPDDDIEIRLITHEETVIDEVHIDRSSMNDIEKYNCNRSIERSGVNLSGRDSSNWNYIAAENHFHTIGYFHDKSTFGSTNVLQLSSNQVHNGQSIQLIHSLNDGANLTLKIYDLNGRYLATIIHQQLVEMQGKLSFQVPASIHPKQLILQVIIEQQDQIQTKNFVLLKPA